MLSELERLQENIDIIIFEPGYNDQTTETQKTNNLTPARAMTNSFKDYQVLGYSINLLVAQKLAYFMQRLGEPLSLEYEKGINARIRIAYSICSNI
ncbi:MAG: hypothetical protein U5Q03_13545 [Bacteroidota bacterium]|nr:hypothetical protein [Bacteroidota bacterium]